ncbi:TetR/AcrR family transcriptional regulator [Flavobacterium sp. RHBU_3]|uniref:TetR/AcrR family transcriptional regulator n=1 Tax=Flavobacterium sp. RHBU_3 TaxID=3391184 RepID=UPI003984B956
MKESILEKAMELYLKLGFKGVTLDDIAQEMSISKKTIYQHFSNRNELIEAVAKTIMEEIKCDIDTLSQGQMDPMEEMFAIRRYLRKTLEGKFQLPIYQLNKFFPEIAQKLKRDQFGKMYESVIDNLKRGIALELYRDDLNLEFVIRIYFAGITGTKDTDLFPEDQFNIHSVTNLYLEYHLRAICTQKGVTLLEKHLKETE